MAKKRKTESDAASKVRQIAEKAKPNMRVVEIRPTVAGQEATSDAIAQDVENARKKYGLRAAPEAKPTKKLHMVVMEPKQTTDARVAPRKLTLIVDEDKVVGEQG
jgi:hypothetical protein